MNTPVTVRIGGTSTVPLPDGDARPAAAVAVCRVALLSPAYSVVPAYSLHRTTLQVSGLTKTGPARSKKRTASCRRARLPCLRQSVSLSFWDMQKHGDA
jgi:hypothetical protein